MISSTASIGGGPNHIFLLCEIISPEFEVFYASPKINNKVFNSKNYIQITERKITLTDILRLINFINKNSIKIIHCHGKGAGLIGRILKLFLNIKLVFTFHGIHLECHSFLYKYIYIIYENIFGLLDDHKVFVSEGELNYARKKNIFIGRKYTVINNAVKSQKIRKVVSTSEDKNELLNSNESFHQKPYIVSVCRLVDQKNIFEIFNIAKILKDFEFNIVGGGPLYKDAKRYLRNHKIYNVYLHNSKLNVFDYLYQADVFLSTSLYEGLPMSLLESMSIGLPVVASDVVGNYNAVINGQTGFLYQLGDINMAAEKIRKIVNSSTINYSFSFNSFKLQREKFSIEVMRNNYLSLYNNFKK